MTAMKYGHLARQKIEGIKVTNIHSDLVLSGKQTYDLYHTAKREGVTFVRTDDPNKVTVEQQGERCVITVPGGNGSSAPATVEADMVVLLAAMEPSEDSARLAEMFGLTLDRYGFVEEEHGRLGAVNTNIHGVQVAGCAQSPGDIQSSVVRGAAAAGKVLGELVPGEKVELETVVAYADPDLCGGCKTCITVCPYKAITGLEDEKRAEVNEALCRGCGTCVSACPGGAISGRHFTDGQLYAEIEGLMR